MDLNTSFYTSRNDARLPSALRMFVIRGPQHADVNVTAVALLTCSCRLLSIFEGFRHHRTTGAVRTACIDAPLAWRVVPITFTARYALSP